jgi:methylenetetrahydrofolate dehydrogenase (NADP+)/methenyltetrahydrofolate cyclohydrolase
MVGRIIDGKAVAAALREQVAAEAEAFTRVHGRVGEDPASVVYTRNKEKAARAAGIRGVLHRLPADIGESALLEHVASLNEREDVDGILVQLPLPGDLDPNRVIDAIDPAKDVDGLHPTSAGLLSAGRPGLVPCTPRGCMKLIAHTGTELRGLHAVMIGRSNLMGKPMAQLLLSEHATVTIAHSRTRGLDELCRSADVLVAAVGRAKMVAGDWIKEGAVVLDVGINRDSDGKLVGDVDTDAALLRAGWITPVPGGVGPMTIACLLENTVIAARQRLGAPAARSAQ